MWDLSIDHYTNGNASLIINDTISSVQVFNANNCGPSANFIAVPQNGVVPLTTTMTIENTSNITACAWDYGDGQTGTSCAFTQEHTYNNVGSYTVSLTVSGPTGYITVNPPCPQINNWMGEYWANTDLSGPRVLCRDDADVNFDWGDGSPDPLLPSDNFSARWTRAVDFAGGTYRFHMGHDDGARLYIDDVPKLNTWGCCSTDEVVDVPLAAGSHVLRMEYFDLIGSANANLWWEAVTAACPTINNWMGEYWSNTDLSGPRALCRDDADVNFNWGNGSPDPTLPVDSFSARWTRMVNFTGSTYRFHMSHDDGARLYIDDVLKMDVWGTCCTTDVVDIPMTAGSHVIRMEYFESVGTASAQLWWESLAPGGFNKTGPSNKSVILSNAVTLTWNSSAGAAAYWVCYDTTNDNACSNWVNNGSSTSKSLSGLAKSTTYYWHVRADNSNGSTYANGSSTAYWSFKTGTTPAAFNKSAPANGATGQPSNPTLTWSASTGAKAYYYCYATTNPCTNWVSNGTSTKKVLSGLSPSTTYYWSVKAVNDFGTTYANVSSLAWSFRTGAKPGAFNKAAPLNHATNQSLSPKLSWGASSGATTYYYCFDTTNNNACSTWVSTGTALSKTLSGLVLNTSYYWQVKAVNSFGTSYANGSSTLFWSFKTKLK